MVAVGIFDSTSTVAGKTIFGTIASNINGPNTITVEQRVALQKVHDLYTVFLAAKQYQSISSNYANYINLLSVLNSIQVLDPKLRILIKIATDGLIGSINSISIYSQYAFKEIALIELNNRIIEILSKKNTHQALSTAKSTMHAVKIIKLNPLFSYYISLYGMPACGIGFDPVKLAFLQNIAM